MWDFAQRGDVQPGVMRQTGCALRQRTGQPKHLIIFDTPRRHNHHRGTEFRLVLGKALLIQSAPVQQPAATASMVIQWHYLIAT
ncbi:hypothetical protein D3C72_1858280 [compost metagenome]